MYNKTQPVAIMVIAYLYICNDFTGTCMSSMNNECKVFSTEVNCMGRML